MGYNLLWTFDRSAAPPPCLEGNSPQLRFPNIHVRKVQAHRLLQSIWVPISSNSILIFINYDLTLKVLYFHLFSRRSYHRRNLGDWPEASNHVDNERQFVKTLQGWGYSSSVNSSYNKWISSETYETWLLAMKSQVPTGFCTLRVATLTHLKNCR